jgi:hypothetical protein
LIYATHRAQLSDAERTTSGRAPDAARDATTESDLAKLRETRDRRLRAAQALTAAASRPGSGAASSQNAQDSEVVDAEVVEDHYARRACSALARSGTSIAELLADRVG